MKQKKNGTRCDFMALSLISLKQRLERKRPTFPFFFIALLYGMNERYQL
jgi:hypothetical protein